MMMMMIGRCGTDSTCISRLQGSCPSVLRYPCHLHVRARACVDRCQENMACIVKARFGSGHSGTAAGFTLPCACKRQHLQHPPISLFNCLDLYHKSPDSCERQYKSRT